MRSGNPVPGPGARPGHLDCRLVSRPDALQSFDVPDGAGVYWPQSILTVEVRRIAYQKRYEWEHRASTVGPPYVENRAPFGDLQKAATIHSWNPRAGRRTILASVSSSTQTPGACTMAKELATQLVEQLQAAGVQ